MYQWHLSVTNTKLYIARQVSKRCVPLDMCIDQYSFSFVMLAKMSIGMWTDLNLSGFCTSNVSGCAFRFILCFSMAFTLSQLLFVQFVRVLPALVVALKLLRRSGMIRSLKYLTKSGAVAAYISWPSFFKCCVQLTILQSGNVAWMAFFMAISSSVPKTGREGRPWVSLTGERKAVIGCKVAVAM